MLHTLARGPAGICTGYLSSGRWQGGDLHSEQVTVVSQVTAGGVRKFKRLVKLYPTAIDSSLSLSQALEETVLEAGNHLHQARQQEEEVEED